MAAGTIRFYLDENVPVAVAEQLQRRGVQVFTVLNVDMRGASDAEHLAKAAEKNCVLCTYDHDFIRLASAGAQHSGIVFGQMQEHGIGHRVAALSLIHTAYAPEDMRNHIEYP